jgi:hypothetical protein
MQLTVGTPDANGNAAASTAYALFRAIPGDPWTTTDEADAELRATVSDVRRRSDLADYDGELQLAVSLRITDRDNSGTNPSATVADLSYTATVPCQPTADTAIGSTCTVSTTADALAPGAAKEGRRAIWELGQMELYDGGPDGVASTAGNTPFLREGVFVP